MRKSYFSSFCLVKYQSILNNDQITSMAVFQLLLLPICALRRFYQTYFDTPSKKEGKSALSTK